MAKQAAVCIVSGGLDSVCYAAMLARNHDIYMITFAYGQRAKREIECARHFARVLNAKDHKIVDIGFMKSLYGESNALTDSRQKLLEEFSQNLVVPVRNAVFITIATAWAMSINATIVAYGAHTGDVPHYPDCRPEFVRAINEALNIAESDAISCGTRQAITITSPAVAGLDKPALLKIGYDVLGDKIFRTWSCYSDGVRTRGGRYLHCGRCESCINRKDAFTTAQIEDKTQYAAKDSSSESQTL
ncbi:MAG TPA: 7-cyano-7-deazaguanine synthase [Nitrososphaera sp.]|nr:7-cyano-7-deazaguanine synthase [Nitrososphaera sp.]